MSSNPLAQHDLPGREPLADAVVYSRRVRVFVWLAALFVGATAMLPVLGFSRMYGASWIVRELGREPPVPLLLPAGFLALPIALLALSLAVGLFGVRRARGLLVAGSLVWGGVLGLLWVTDHMPAYDNSTTNAFWLGVALVACGLVTCLVQIEVFWLVRRLRWLRHLFATALGIAAGWGAFWGLVRGLHIALPPDAQLLGLALGAGGYTWLVAVVGALPLALVARGLAVYLRVALREEKDPAASDPGEPAFVVGKPRAMVVDTPVPGRLRKRPYTTEELAFFDRGDELER